MPAGGRVGTRSLPVRLRRRRPPRRHRQRHSLRPRNSSLVRINSRRAQRGSPQPKKRTKPRPQRRRGHGDGAVGRRLESYWAHQASIPSAPAAHPDQRTVAGASPVRDPPSSRVVVMAENVEIIESMVASGIIVPPYRGAPTVLSSALPRIVQRLDTAAVPMTQKKRQSTSQPHVHPDGTPQNRAY